MLVVCGKIMALNNSANQRLQNFMGATAKNHRRSIQMSIYKIPLKFKTGVFRYSELELIPDKEDGSLELDYNAEYRMLTYRVPMYKNKARIYTVPEEQMPDGLTAVYGDSGELDKVELAGAGRARLIYLRFKNIEASKKDVLEFVKEQADRMSAEIIGKKQKFARLFFGKFYDGEAVEIAVKTATEEEMKAVIDKYGGKPDAADNSGNYPVKNMIMLDREPLGVMLMCTDKFFQSELFDLASEAVEKQIKSCILNKIDKTDDFEFLSEECD